MCTHTYIIGHHNPSVRIIDQFLTSLMLCVLILYISGGTYSLKTTPNDMAELYTLRVFARNLLRGNHRRNTFCISFWCLTWDSNPSFSSYRRYGIFKAQNPQIWQLWSLLKPFLQMYNLYHMLWIPLMKVLSLEIK